MAVLKDIADWEGWADKRRVKSGINVKTRPMAYKRRTAEREPERKREKLRRSRDGSSLANDVYCAVNAGRCTHSNGNRLQFPPNKAQQPHQTKESCLLF